MARAIPFIAAAATFLVTGSFQAASLAFGVTNAVVGATTKPKNAGQERQASIINLSVGEIPREFVFGRVRSAGSLVDGFNFGGQYGTRTVTRCIALADHAIDGIEGFYVDNKYYPWVGEGLQAAFSNKLSFHFRNATAEGHIPPLHVRQNSSWTEADRLVGVTHIWIDTVHDDETVFPSVPVIDFVFRGMRLYDMRRDPALGYTGPNPQTWEDRSTHVWSENAYLARYAFMRGIYCEGRQGQPQHRFVGRGLSAVEAPPERAIAAANLCDEIVNGAPRYRAAGVISADRDFASVEADFEAAMAGLLVQREGGLEIEPGQAKAVVASITDDDLVVGEPVTFSEFLPDSEGGRTNTVVPRYVEPAQNWKEHGSTVLRLQADIIDDGGPKELVLPLAFVTYRDQADRCGEIAHRMARLERRAGIVLPPEFSHLEEGDWIEWTSARRHGGATVRYRIEQFGQGADWRSKLRLREIASSVFGVPDPVPNPVAPPPPPVPVDALQLLGVDAEAITLPGETSAIPAVRFTWDTPVDASTLAIRGEVRVQGETATAETRTDDIQKGELIATNGVAPNQTLEARLVPIGDPSRPVVPSPWRVITTGELVADDTAKVGGRSASDLIAEVDGLFETYGDTVAAGAAAAAADASRQAAEAAEQGAVNARDEATIARSAAEGARDSAIAEAMAAGGHASFAGSKADEAAGSASAASGSAIVAQTAEAGARGAAIETLPSTFEGGKKAFFTEAPQVWAALPVEPNTSTRGVAEVDEGTVFYSNITEALGTLGRVALVPLGAHKVSARVKVTADGAHAVVWVLGGAVFDADQVHLGDYWRTYSPPRTTADGWETWGQDNIFTTEEVRAQFPTAAFMRPAVLQNWSPNGPGGVSGSSSWILSLDYQDANGEQQSKIAASASFASAQAADASATEAGQQASIATTERGLAETARGQAEVYRDQSAGSASSAAGSASTATTQAGLATTARGEAQGFASASAASAAAAQASSDTAGEQASVSTSERIAAQAARGDAAGFASAASGSASAASASADLAGTRASAAEAARLAAETAESQAGIARNAAVAAQSGAEAAEAAAFDSYTQTSRISLSTLTDNPAFANFPDAGNPAFPTSWQGWGTNNDQSRAPGRFSPWSFRQHNNKDSTTTEGGIVQSGAVNPGLAGLPPGKYVIVADVTLTAGALGGAGVLFYTQAGAGPGSSATLDFATDPDTSGVVHGNTSVTRSYSFSKVVDLPAAGNGIGIFHAMTGWNGFPFGGNAPKILQWDRCFLRPATASEVAAGRADQNAAQALSEIAVEQSTRAAETAALAARQSTTEARITVVPNLIENGNFASGLDHWFLESGPGPGVGNDDALGTYLYVPQGSYVVSEVYPLIEGRIVAVGWSGVSDVSSANVYIQALPSYALLSRAYRDGENDWRVRHLSDESFPAPPGTTGFRVVCDPAGGNAGFSSIKVNFGYTASDFTDERTNADYYSRTSITESSVADAQAKLAVARLVLLAEASGGRPARVGLFSDNQGNSDIVLDAARIWFGENTVFDDATDTLQTVWGTTRRVLALGAAFGTDGTITEWEGPDGTALSAMSRANAFSGRANVAPRVFGSAQPGGQQVTVSPARRTVNAPGSSGNISMGSFTVNTLGLSGPITYEFAPAFGNDIFSVFSQSGATANIRANGAQVGQIYTSTFLVTTTETNTGRQFTNTIYLTLITETLS